MVVMLSFVSLLNCRSLSLSDPLLYRRTSLPFSSFLSLCLRITAAVIYSGKKQFSKEISNHSEEDKGAEMSQAGGAGWAVTWACSEMTHESMAGVPTHLLHMLSKCDPSDIYFKRPLVPVFAQRGRNVLYESICTF